MMEGCPEEFWTRLEFIIDYIEDDVCLAKNYLTEVKSVADLNKVEDAYSTLTTMSNYLY